MSESFSPFASVSFSFPTLCPQLPCLVRCCSSFVSFSGHASFPHFSLVSIPFLSLTRLPTLITEAFIPFLILSSYLIVLFSVSFLDAFSFSYLLFILSNYLSSFLPHRSPFLHFTILPLFLDYPPQHLFLSPTSSPCLFICLFFLTSLFLAVHSF